MEHYSLEQIVLLHHFAIREEKRLIDYQANLTAGKIAELLVAAFGQ